MIIENATSRWHVGGKAYNLLLLKQIGLNVPDFFIIRFDNENEIRDRINQTKIIEECKKLNCDFFSVRSSATCEDGLCDSFAGLFESCICVPVDQIFNAISIVLKSMEADSVKDYLSIKHGVNTTINIEMRVIIQRQVNSQVSGVCYTRHPIENDYVLIESCYGQGESLVCGSTIPEEYKILRSSTDPLKYTYKCGSQEEAIYLDTSLYSDSQISCIRTETLQISKQRTLTDSQLRSLFSQSLFAEERLRFDGADIEWAIENDQIYFLQIRALTKGEDASEL